MFHILFILLLLFNISLSIRLKSSPDEDYEDGFLSIPIDAIGRPSLPINNVMIKEEGSNECYCSYGTEEGICEDNDICIKDDKAACFHHIQEHFNDDTQEMEILHMYGCATHEKGSDGSHFTCHAHLIPFNTPMSIACCYEGHKCNLNITPPSYAGVNEFEYKSEGPIENSLSMPIMIASIVLLIILLTAIGILLNLIRLRKIMKKMNDIEKSDEEKPMIDSSGSGSRGGTMNQRTIGQDLHILSSIGKGRFGEVRKALYRGSFVAVKTFYTTDEDSWLNEREIYYSEMFNHQNVLQFVAADICSVDSITQMLLITDFHPLGSLSQYLQDKEKDGINCDEALSLAFTTVCGLEHLHSSVHGTGGKRKPQIAHRDLKSRNVIVKRPGVCCIADFGLAVRFTTKMIPEKPKVQVGTKRYMAPEVLSKTLNPSIFNSFMMADIYSLSLVFWEILTRVQLTPDPSSLLLNHRAESDSSGLGDSISDSPKNSNQNSSQESSSRNPFEGLVHSDPSCEDMKKVVVDKNQRPKIEPEWLTSKLIGLPTLTKITVNCWHTTPEVRPTALRIKLDLRRALDLSASNANMNINSFRLKDERKDSGVAMSTQIS